MRSYWGFKTISTETKTILSKPPSFRIRGKHIEMFPPALKLHIQHLCRIYIIPLLCISKLSQPCLSNFVQTAQPELSHWCLIFALTHLRQTGMCLRLQPLRRTFLSACGIMLSVWLGTLALVCFNITPTTQEVPEAMDKQSCTRCVLTLLHLDQAIRWNTKLYRKKLYGFYSPDTRQMWQGLQHIADYSTITSSIDDLPDDLNTFHTRFETSSYSTERRHSYRTTCPSFPPQSHHVIYIKHWGRSNSSKVAGLNNIPRWAFRAA